MAGSERRRHKRRTFEEDAYTYIDGSRLDSLSMDVSPGGAEMDQGGDPGVSVRARLVSCHRPWDE